MSDKIYLRRGNKADLPALAAGEPGVAIDTKQVFAGTDGTLAGIIGLSSALSGGDKIQSGSTTISAAPNTTTNTVITFPKAFSSAPIIIVSTGTGSPQIFPSSWAISSPTGFTAYVYNNSAGAGSVVVNWIAIGA